MDRTFWSPCFWPMRCQLDLSGISVVFRNGETTLCHENRWTLQTPLLTSSQWSSPLTLVCFFFLHKTFHTSPVLESFPSTYSNFITNAACLFFAPPPLFLPVLSDSVDHHSVFPTTPRYPWPRSFPSSSWPFGPWYGSVPYSHQLDAAPLFHLTFFLWFHPYWGTISLSFQLRPTFSFSIPP